MKFYLHCSVPYQILHTLGRRDGYCCPVPVFQTEQHLWLAAFGSAIKYNSPLDRPDMFTFYLLKSCGRIHKKRCLCCLPVTCSGACCGPWVPLELCEETSAHPRRGAGLGERHDGHWGFSKRGFIFIYLFLWGKYRCELLHGQVKQILRAWDAPSLLGCAWGLEQDTRQPGVCSGTPPAAPCHPVPPGGRRFSPQGPPISPHRRGGPEPCGGRAPRRPARSVTGRAAGGRLPGRSPGSVREGEAAAGGGTPREPPVGSPPPAAGWARLRAASGPS